MFPFLNGWKTGFFVYTTGLWQTERGKKVNRKENGMLSFFPCSWRRRRELALGQGNFCLRKLWRREAIKSTLLLFSHGYISGMCSWPSWHATVRASTWHVWEPGNAKVVKEMTAYMHTQLGLMLAGFITSTSHSIITHMVRSCQRIRCALSVSSNPNTTRTVCLRVLSGSFAQTWLGCAVHH